MELGVLFCDQVGSTALLTRLGDALAEEIRRDLFEALHQAAELCRGDVVKGSGDGLMVVFRAGAADALRCGELMLKKVGRLARRELWSDVQFKVGVSYGEAVFDKDDWYGAAVNLAARLCAAAEPQQLLTSAAAVAGASGWQPLPSMTLKGFPEPVAVSAKQIDGSDQPPSPIPVELDITGTLPLVGRREAMSVLMAAHNAAAVGERQLLRVEGPPGVGVSRLVAEFANRVASDAVVLSARSGSGADWVQQLIRSHSASANTEDLRTDVGPDAAALTAICPLIGLRLHVASAEGSTEPAEALLFRLITRIAKRAPVAVVLDGLSPEIKSWASMPPRSFVVSAGRLESDAAHPVKRVVLEPLTSDEVRALLDSARLSDRGWRSELDALVVTETDGIPRDVVAVVDQLSRELVDRDLRPAAAFDAVRRAVPYKGLQVFDDDDGVRFFGRERAVVEVMTGLDAQAFVAVVGSSGSGKSSVVRAGCAPRLVARGAELIVVAPGENPLRMLAIAWSRASGGDAEVLHERLRSDPTALARTEPASDGRVLVVDQLEECFTLCSDEQERDQYLRTITHPIAGLRVLATLRGDFFGRASEHPELAEALRAGTVLMAPPTRSELRAVIEQPAAAAHLRLETGLSDLILSDVSDRPGSLPLLSHALRETWRRRRGRDLSIAGYQEAGGATGAIARTADSVYERLTDPERDIAKRIFLRLTALGEGTEDSRRRVPVDVLVPGGSQDNHRVLQTLTAARLVTADTDAEGRDVDELAHEALLREWPRLRSWLDDDRDELRVLAHLETSAREWDAADQPETELYSGRRLEAAETISGDKLNDRERTYLTASLRRRDAVRRAARRSRRRLQTFAVVVVVLLIISTIAGIVAVNKSSDAQKKTREAQQQAQLATAQNLTTQSKEQLAAQPDLSMLLAEEAQKLHDSPQTRAALLTAVYANPLIAHISAEFGNAKGEFDLSPDGQAALVAGQPTISGQKPDSLQLWDFGSQTLTATIKADPAPKNATNPIAGAEFSSKGTFAVAMADGVVRLYSQETGKPTGAVLKIPKPVALTSASLAFSPDGTVLALSDPSKGRFMSWRVIDGKLISSRTGLPANDGVSNIVFSPDGKRVALVESSPAVVHIVDSISGRDLAPPVDAHEDGAELAYSPNGHDVAIAPIENEFGDGPGKGGVIIVDTGHGKTKTYSGIGFRGGNADPRSGIAYSPDGKYLAVGNGYGIATVLRTSDGTTDATLSLSGADLISLAFTPYSDQIVTATPSEVLTWNIAANAMLPEKGQGDWGSSATAFAVDPKHQRFIVAGADGRLHFWTTGTLRPLGESAKLAHGVSYLTVNPATGDVAAVLNGGNAPNGFPAPGAGVDLVRSTAPFAVIRHLAAPGTNVSQAAYSPSGRQLAVTTGADGKGGRVVVFDLEKPNDPTFAVSTDDPVSAGPVRWNADGERILVGGTSSLVTVDFRSRKIVSKREIPTQEGQVGDIQLSGRDGSLLSTTEGPVSGPGTGHIIFSTPNGAASNHADLVLTATAALTLTPDGTLLATNEFGSGLELWALPSGQRLATSIPDPLTSISATVNSPSAASQFDGFIDRHRLLLVNDDQFAIVDLASASLDAKACAIAGRNLTRQEFSSYLGSVPYHKTCPQWSAGS